MLHLAESRSKTPWPFHATIRVRTLRAAHTRSPERIRLPHEHLLRLAQHFRPTIPPKELLLSSPLLRGSSRRVVAEVAEGALRLFSARVRGSPYCGVLPLSVATPIAEKFVRHAWSQAQKPRCGLRLQLICTCRARGRRAARLPRRRCPRRRRARLPRLAPPPRRAIPPWSRGGIGIR